MIKITARFPFLQRFRAAAMRRAAAAPTKLAIALDEAAAAVQGEAQRLIADPPKTGRVYQKYNPRRVHQASAKGQAPATDLGTLIQSIVIDRTDVPRGRIVIAATAKHAKFLELGTRKMAPRPFLRRALRTMRRRVIRIVRSAL